MREDLMKQVELEFENRRLENEREENRRKKEIAENYPDLLMLMNRREELIYGSIRSFLRGGSQLDTLPDRMDAVSTEIRNKLTEKGFPPDYLAPVYQCAVCKDTGFTGENIKTMCSCMNEAYLEKVRRELNLSGNGNETFEQYDETLFPVTPLPGHSYSQRQVNEVIRNVCEAWADQWPRSTPRDMLLMGKSGLGKTYFLRAMASRLAEKNCKVILISAYRFFETARKSYFENDGGMDELIQAEVLMMDDLGSEPMMKNITIEQLFNLINERQNRDKPTLLSTNLSEEEFRTRYTERIASRICNTKTCNILRFEGADIRTGRS